MTIAIDAATPALSPDALRALANAALPTQIGAMQRIIVEDPDLMAILRVIRASDLPDAWLWAGCLYQTVWNRISDYPRRTGIKDYDIGYFDAADLSYEAEDRAIKRLAAMAPPDLNIEVRNQARVHLWFEQRFGFAVPPLTCAIEAQTRYASTTHAIGARLAGDDSIEIVAPFGLRDLFAMYLRPNRSLPNKESHNAKALRCQEIWPAVTVEWW